MVSPFVVVSSNMYSVYYIQVLEAEISWYFPKPFTGKHDVFGEMGFCDKDLRLADF